MIRLNGVAVFAVTVSLCFRAGAAQYDGCTNGTVADIGNGRCDAANNNPSCGFDGGDVSVPPSGLSSSSSPCVTRCARVLRLRCVHMTQNTEVCSLKLCAELADALECRKRGRLLRKTEEYSHDVRRSTWHGLATARCGSTSPDFLPPYFLPPPSPSPHVFCNYRLHEPFRAAQ